MRQRSRLPRQPFDTFFQHLRLRLCKNRIASRENKNGKGKYGDERNNQKPPDQ